MVVGVLVASVMTRWRFGRASYARWLVLALAPVPAYVHALAWQSAFSRPAIRRGLAWAAGNLIDAVRGYLRIIERYRC